MVIKRLNAFESAREEAERAKDKSKVVPLRLNTAELALLENDARLLRQEKIGTTIKQLVEIGRNVLHAPQTAAILEAVFNNERRNERLGIVEVEPKFTQK
ncbi:hypothetical protein DRH27_06170 [Candidatus Falkowbacteria bacterium]|nr:MAG: hypothetical protein DRH27_06170 [Candidatus Falkowbacteria bacterium]